MLNFKLEALIVSYSAGMCISSKLTGAVTFGLREEGFRGVANRIPSLMDHLMSKCRGRWPGLVFGVPLLKY